MSSSSYSNDTGTGTLIVVTVTNLFTIDDDAYRQARFVITHGTTVLTTIQLVEGPTFIYTFNYALPAGSSTVSLTLIRGAYGNASVSGQLSLVNLKKWGIYE